MLSATRRRIAGLGLALFAVFTMLPARAKGQLRIADGSVALHRPARQTRECTGAWKAQNSGF